MHTRYDDLIAELGRAAQPDRSVPPDLAAYVAKVRRDPRAITHREVLDLKLSHTEDEIFEQTVSAAAAAGLERLRLALGTLR